MSESETIVQAARGAIGAAMAEDESVLVIGEDISGGGPFALTKGLIDEYGAGRVRNTPICEGTFVGAAVGMSLAGARPLVDIMFNDFLTVASDQLFNAAAKIHYMSGGRYSVPLTVWTIAGAEGRWGAHHSQHLAGWLVQVPGLKVLAPASPQMAAASLRAALADPDPVIVIVDRPLLYSRAPLDGDDGSPWSSRTVRTGTDVTVAAAGRAVHLALQAATNVDASVEVIDLQRLAPLDVSAVVESVSRTTRLVIVHEEVSVGGLTNLVESRVLEGAFWALDAPVERVTAPDTPIPAAGVLEDAYVIDSASIANAIERTLRP
jgi:acetoin:2,6-dichlorophenolindophenol oxidoreductase subunit beta